MKFLCDNCKAKYQIADEKVAGKTVRMKCRKCGHQIEVRAAVTETSAAAQPPRPPPPGGGGPRPPQRSGLATSLSATKPRAPTPSMAPSSALAGAFKSNVQDAPNSVSETRGATIELSVTDEWYVAINGVPVGPVRISELRRKAAAGAVTEESLCWQEGLEEWRPIRSIPELAALVREAAQGNRPSLIGTPPPELPVRPSIPSAPSASRQPVAPGRSNTPPPRPVAPSAPSVQRSNVVPLRPAASSQIDEVGLGPGNAAPAYAPSPTPLAPPVFTPQPQRLSLPPPTIDPFAVPPAPPAMAPSAPYRDSVHPGTPSFHPPAYMDPPKRQGVPLWFWPILVLALGFGGGVAFLVFRPQPAPAPVVIQMPQATAQPTAPPTDVPPPPPTPEPTPTTTETKKTGPVAARNTPKAAPEEKKGLDLGGLVPGGGGPNVGPGGPGPSGGGGLDQAGVERVVAGHRAGVKRTCWERGGDQKSSVNVTVTANVAPNGSVSSTSSSGDDPVVAKCIESQVKSWSFPAPGSPTTINIPFKFVRQ
jgi:predicted Zn finger-like uncharacterized protein